MKDVDPKLYPLAQDGMEFWNILYKYVSSYINIYWKNDQELLNDRELFIFWDVLSKSFPGPGLPSLTLQSIAEVLTQFIFYVSAVHTQVGSVGAYCKEPDFAAGCVGENQRIAFPQNFYAQISITVATAGEMPMMLDDWSHLFERKDAKDVFAIFHNELQQLSKTIDERNKNKKIRKWPFNNFNPAHTETSIAV